MNKQHSTREKILKAAFQLFSTSPYHKISVDEIAKAAGVSKGGLFHHFESKYILAIEAFQWYIEKEFNKFLTPEHRESRTPEQQLRDIIDYSIDYLVQDVQFTGFILSLAHEAYEMGEDPHIMMNYFKEYVDMIHDIYVEMKVKNPRMKALLLMVTLDGYGMYHMYLNQIGEKTDSKRLKQELYSMFIPEK
jgi:AcrR family transcriptional regulator